MISPRARSSLFAAIAIACLGTACSPNAADDSDASIGTPDATSAEVSAQDVAEGAKPGITVEPVETEAGPDAPEEIPLNPMDRPTSHEALSFSLHSSVEQPALEPTLAHDQMWVAVEEDTPLTMCVSNKAAQPALVALSIQGRDVDFSPAHPTNKLWRVDAQTTRCISSGNKDKNYPAVVAWNAFFFMGEGQDGSRIDDVRTRAAASGFIRLERPSKEVRPNAWPALQEAEEVSELATPANPPAANDKKASDTP